MTDRYLATHVDNCVYIIKVPLTYKTSYKLYDRYLTVDFNI